MLYVLARTKAKAGHESAVRASALSIVAPTRAEAGCVLYDLHIDQSNPGHFVFYEIWQDRASLDAHARSAHIKAHRQRVSDLVESTDITLMDKIA